VGTRGIFMPSNENPIYPRRVMFTKTSEIESMLDAEIRSTLAVMEGLEKTDEKYGKLLEHVTKLHKLPTSSGSSRSSDTNTWDRSPAKPSASSSSLGNRQTWTDTIPKRGVV
jgi:hypothetical protein